LASHCKTGTRWSLTGIPNHSKILNEKIAQFVASYSCDSCLGTIGVLWDRQGNSGGEIVAGNPRPLIRTTEPYDFDHVPASVAKEIKEALDCLSVGAHNGFGGCCRRAIQALCTNLGAEASTKVKNQVQEMAAATGLEQEWVDLVLEVMLAGHDGSHPHLPALDGERSAVILSLLQDLTYQLYTRPGKVKEAATMRKAAIQKKP
jgi:hypothetical protein